MKNERRKKNNRKRIKHNKNEQQQQQQKIKQNEKKFEQNAGWYAWMAIKSPKYFGVGVEKLSVKNSLGKLNVEISLWKTQLPTS